MDGYCLCCLMYIHVQERMPYTTVPLLWGPSLPFSAWWLAERPWLPKLLPNKSPSLLFEGSRKLDTFGGARRHSYMEEADYDSTMGRRRSRRNRGHPIQQQKDLHQVERLMRIRVVILLVLRRVICHFERWTESRYGDNGLTCQALADTKAKRRRFRSSLQGKAS